MAQFYTLEEAARVLGMDAEQLKSKAQRREVRAFLDSGSWRFQVSYIDELARRTGMGSNPDLSLSDLELPQGPSGDLSADDSFGELPSEGIFDTESGTPELSEYNLDARSGSSSQSPSIDPDDSVDHQTIADATFASAGPNAQIIGMNTPGDKQPSDSDVRLVPEDQPKGASDSDVRLSSAEIPIAPGAGDNTDDVTLVREGSSDAIEAFPQLADDDSDPSSETTLRSSPISSVGGSDSDDEGSDFELTPSSVIDALQPESGSDFELTALDGSEELFDPTQGLRPSDSDVTGVDPSTSGVGVARPNDSGPVLQNYGALDEGFELEPLVDESFGSGDPSATSLPIQGDPSATSLPSTSPVSDPSQTALPTRNQGPKDIFEDTDFEVEAFDSGENQTVQLDIQSDFELSDSDSDSGSEVFAVDEDDVDDSAKTSMGASPAAAAPVFEDDDDEDLVEMARSEESTPGFSGSGLGEESLTSTPSTSTTQGRAGLLSEANAAPWGGLWVGILSTATVLLMVLAFITMDVVRNLNSFQGDTTVVSGLVKLIAGGE